MRYALGRILWIVPTLVLVSIAAFWVLSSGVGRYAPSVRAAAGVLPRFFNPEPRTVRDLAARAMTNVATGGSEAAASRLELQRLGGAALPFVLPRMDALGPEGQRRVAISLEPIAKRMGVGTPDELERPEAAVLFWSRVWEDRAIDFKPSVVKRLVRRLSQRSNELRRAELIQLDTYALPELIAQLGSVRTPDDVSRVHRLSAVAAHVTGLPWQVDEGAGVESAAGTAMKWRRFWIERRADYTTLYGLERVMAMLLDTQYGHWALDAAQARLGTTANGKAVLEVFRERGPLTLWLLAVGLCAGYAAGVAWGIATALTKGTWFDRIGGGAAIALVALPPALLLTGFLWAKGGSRSLGAATLFMTLISAAWVSRYQRVSARNALEQDFTRTLLAQGASRWHLGLRTARGSSSVVLSRMSVDVPVLLTISFVIERAFSLDGLGETTLRALHTGDVTWLMACALIGATCTAVLQIANDLLSAALDRRVLLGLADRRGARE